MTQGLATNKTKFHSNNVAIKGKSQIVPHGQQYADNSGINSGILIVILYQDLKVSQVFFLKLSSSSSFLSFSQPAEREKTGGSSTSAPLVIAFKSSKPFDNTRLFLWMLCLEGAHLSAWPYRFLAPIFHFTERSLTSRATSPRFKEDWPMATWQPLNSCSRKKFSQNPSLLTYMWQQTPDQLQSWQWFLFLFVFLSFHNCFI